MTKRHLAAVGCAVLVTGLVGCNHPPSEVADVDGVRIDAAEVREQAAAVESALQAEPGTIAMPTIAQFMIGGLVAEQVAEQTGHRISSSRMESFVASSGTQLSGLTELWADPDSREFAEDWVAPMILAKELGQDRYLSAAAAVPVELNPAYGTWGPRTHAVTPGGSLSTPYRS